MLKCQSGTLDLWDMVVDYDGAFNEVILKRRHEAPNEQWLEAQSPRRRGQLVKDAPESHSLYDSWNYQRGHADVFREVYKQSSHSPPRKGEHLSVVDIGAGAGTVAVALAEALGRKKRQRVDYFAFDPNPMMRELGEEILEHLGAGFRSAEYIASLEEIHFTDTNRLLFTFSYVSDQEAVEQADIDSWASLIRRAVVEMDRSVELIYTTATFSVGGALASLKRVLEQDGIVRSHQPVAVRVQQRFPFVEPGDSKVVWRERNELWKVTAEHWILST